MEKTPFTLILEDYVNDNVKRLWKLLPCEDGFILHERFHHPVAEIDDILVMFYRFWLPLDAIVKEVICNYNMYYVALHRNTGLMTVMLMNNVFRENIRKLIYEKVDNGLVLERQLIEYIPNSFEKYYQQCCTKMIINLSMLHFQNPPNTYEDIMELYSKFEGKYNLFYREFVYNHLLGWCLKNLCFECSFDDNAKCVFTPVTRSDFNKKRKGTMVPLNTMSVSLFTILKSMDTHLLKVRNYMQWVSHQIYQFVIDQVCLDQMDEPVVYLFLNAEHYHVILEHDKYVVGLEYERFKKSMENLSQNFDKTAHLYYLMNMFHTLHKTSVRKRHEGIGRSSSFNN